MAVGRCHPVAPVPSCATWMLSNAVANPRTKIIPPAMMTPIFINPAHHGSFRAMGPPGWQQLRCVRLAGQAGAATKEPAGACLSTSLAATDRFRVSVVAPILGIRHRGRRALREARGVIPFAALALVLPVPDQ